MLYKNELLQRTMVQLLRFRLCMYLQQISFTLMCTSIHSAGKSAAALKTLKGLKGSRMVRPHPLDEASVVPVNLVEWCVASYHDAPFIRWCTSRHVWNSSRPRPFWTVIMAAFTLPPCGGTSQCVCTYGTCTNWQVERQRICLCTSRPSARGLRKKSIHL